MGRRPRADDSAPIEDLIDSLPRPEPRADLGNFPEETSSLQAQTSDGPASAATPDDNATPDSTPAPSATPPVVEVTLAAEPSAPDEADAAEGAEGDAGEPTEIDTLRTQLATLQQQVDFFRQGAQQAQPSPEQLLQQVMTPTQPYVPFQISPQDIRTIVENPEQAATMLNQAFHVFGQHLTQLILNQGAGLMNVREHLRGREQQANSTFWAGNADLTDLAPHIQAYAQQMQQAGATDANAILAEAGRRVRMQFGRFTASPGQTPARASGTGRAAKTPVLGAKPTRARPAFSERTTGSRANGPTRLNAVEADILDLARR